MISLYTNTNATYSYRLRLKTINKSGFPRCVILLITSDKPVPAHRGKRLVRSRADGALINAYKGRVN